MEYHGEISGDHGSKSFPRAPFAGKLCAVDRVLLMSIRGHGPREISRLTVKTKTLFRIAQTRTNRPAPNTIVVVTFFKSFSLDIQSMGMGIKIR